MSSNPIKTRLGLVLAVPILGVIAALYFLGAKSAQSYHLVDIYQRFAAEGLIAVVFIVGLAVFLFFKYSRGRLTEVTLNEAGIQACYFNEDSKWFDWSEIKNVSKSFNRLTLTGNFGETMELPMFLFKGSDRKYILECVERYTAN